MSTFPRPTCDFVTPATVPVNVGEASGALRSSAVCVAVDTGLLASEVLLTLPRPTCVAVTPETVPVNVGEAIGAYVEDAVDDSNLLFNCV